MTTLLTIKHQALHQLALEVPEEMDVSDRFITMREIMIKHKGIGLAANQVGILERLIIVGVLEIINPRITKTSSQTFTSVEGCLSVPGKRYKIKRHKIVTVEGFDRNWNPLKHKLRGLDAACVQHEIDHLDGITIADRKQG